MENRQMNIFPMRAQMRARQKAFFTVSKLNILEKTSPVHLGASLMMGTPVLWGKAGLCSLHKAGMESKRGQAWGQICPSGIQLLGWTERVLSIG